VNGGMEPADQYHSEKDAALLERAAEVLQRRFGRLTSGDLIDGLTGAALSLRARVGDSPVIKPAEEPASEQKPEPAEGWGVIRPGDRKAHYYRDGFSLCRRVGLYSGPLSPDEFESEDDHKQCRLVRNREKAKAAALEVRDAG
jgi:hypothetical protein